MRCHGERFAAVEDYGAEFDRLEGKVCVCPWMFFLLIHLYTTIDFLESVL